MKRRNFLKGFLAATGTLAVAPVLVLESVENYGKSELWPIVEEMIDAQMNYNRMMREMDRLIGMPKVMLFPPVIPENYIP